MMEIIMKAAREEIKDVMAEDSGWGRRDGQNKCKEKYSIVMYFYDFWWEETGWTGEERRQPWKRSSQGDCKMSLMKESNPQRAI